MNCARGGILDEAALAQALTSGAIGAAALDVFEHEPVVDDHPLAQFDNVVLTLHSAATTREGARAMAFDGAEHPRRHRRPAEPVLRRRSRYASVTARLGMMQGWENGADEVGGIGNRPFS